MKKDNNKKLDRSKKNLVVAFKALVDDDMDLALKHVNETKNDLELEIILSKRTQKNVECAKKMTECYISSYEELSMTEEKTEEYEIAVIPIILSAEEKTEYINMIENRFIDFLECVRTKVGMETMNLVYEDDYMLELIAEEFSFIYMSEYLKSHRPELDRPLDNIWRPFYDHIWQANGIYAIPHLVDKFQECVKGILEKTKGRNTCYLQLE